MNVRNKKITFSNLHLSLNARVVYMVLYVVLCFVMILGAWYVAKIIHEVVYPAYTYIQTQEYVAMEDMFLQDIDLKLFDNVRSNYQQKKELTRIQQLPNNPFSSLINPQEKTRFLSPAPNQEDMLNTETNPQFASTTQETLVYPSVHTTQ